MNIFKTKRSINFVAGFVLLFGSPLVMAAEATPAVMNQYPAWEATKPYPKDSIVTYNGQIYKAQWWVEMGVAPYIGQNPWDSPWVLLTNDDPPTQPLVTAPLNDSTAIDNKVTVSWHWNAVADGVVGTSWKVSDTFNNTTSVIVTSTQFLTNTPTGQSGSAVVTLAQGKHGLTVQLCNAQNTCTNATAVNVTVPAAAVPGVPVLTASSSSNGKLNLSWAMNGSSGAYWEVWRDATRFVSNKTQFDENTANSQKGSLKDYPISNGTYNLKVKLCNVDAVCADSNLVTVTISGGSDRKHFFMAYYPTWNEPGYSAFDDKGNPLDDAAIQKKSRLAGGIPDYVTHVVLAFSKLSEMHNYTGLSKDNGDLQKLGIQLTTSSASLKESIRILKERNPGTKVILALGGAKYNDYWNFTSDDIAKLTNLINDLELDGVDIDYEKVGTKPAIIEEYYNIIDNVRKAVDAAGGKAAGKILTIPGWSTGADCTAETQGVDYPTCAGKVSYYGDNAGRERLVLQGKGAAAKIDLVAVMSYDADYTNFDPVTAYRNYREIVAPGTPVALGIQPSPDEGWGNARTLVQDRGVNNKCEGNVILHDQYGAEKPGTFSVARFANEVSQNPGDGMMMWSLFAYRELTGNDIVNPGQPLSACADEVTVLAQGISEYLDIGLDRTTKIDFLTGINYGR